MGRKATKLQHVEPEDQSQEEIEALEATKPDKDSAPAAKPRRGRKPSDPGTVSKSEAARSALAAGYESPKAAVDYIKKQHGIEMSPQHFSAVKTQINKKEGEASPKGKPGRKPKAASQAVEGYLAPPPKPIEATGEGDLLDALAAMKPLIAQYGPDKVKKMVDLLG